MHRLRGIRLQKQEIERLVFAIVGRYQEKSLIPVLYQTNNQYWSTNNQSKIDLDLGPKDLISRPYSTHPSDRNESQAEKSSLPSKEVFRIESVPDSILDVTEI